MRFDQKLHEWSENQPMRDERGVNRPMRDRRVDDRPMRDLWAESRPMRDVREEARPLSEWAGLNWPIKKHDHDRRVRKEVPRVAERMR